ncbi:MAG: hypothetical protein ABIX37_03185, partial [Gammaproteobacteria bacterium]
PVRPLASGPDWRDASLMPTTRPPQTLLETITANIRPQPAIPAVLVLMISGLFAGAAVQAGGSSFAAWALTGGLVVSCGLAVAAGFCSVFPTIAWIGLAGLIFGVNAGRFASHTRAALVAGLVGAGVMTLLQVWRVRTGRFVPTITDQD